MATIDETNKLAQATQKLREEEQELNWTRSEEAKQVAKVTAETDRLKKKRGELEDEYKETFKSLSDVSWQSLGKELKDGLFAPLKSIINSIPGPLKSIGKMLGKGALDFGKLFLRSEKKTIDPGVRFDEGMGGGGRWRESFEDGSLGKMVKGSEAEALGGDKSKHTFGKENLEETEVQTGILMDIYNALKGPDSSKLNEIGLGGEGADGEGPDTEKPKGILGKLGAAFKKIGAFLKKFLTWKKLLILALGAILTGLAVKFWEPIKETVIKIKDKIVALATAIKEWFMSIFNWGMEKGKDEDGEWSLMTFITNIWKDVKAWFVGLWEWASDRYCSWLD